MRRLLLDTHVALWVLGAPELIAPELREALSDPRNEVLVSAASVWEVEIKRASGKLESPQGFADRCVSIGFDELAITFEHAERAGALPLHHADPFDRMLVAQALCEHLEIVTSDRRLADYGVPIVAPR